MILSRMRRWGYVVEQLTEKKPAAPPPVTETTDTTQTETTSTQ